MSYTVIHYEQRRQYLLTFIASLLVSFGLGFWLGYHTNADKDEADNVSSAWTTDEEDQHPAADAPISAQPAVAPTVVVSTAVTSPAQQPASQADKKTLNQAAVQSAAQPGSAPVAAKPVIAPAAMPLPAVAPDTKPTPVAIPPSAVPTPAPVAETTPAPVASEITNESLSAEAANTFYSVQAGVYDSRENAVRLVNELNGKGFVAYVHEFVSGAGDTRFNVRFARNTDREVTQKKLTRYKQLYTSSAYIVTEK